MQPTTELPKSTEREQVPDFFKPIVNQAVYGIGSSVAANLGRLGQEASSEIVRSARFAQANYHRMLDVARQLKIPLDEEDFLNSAGVYRDAEGYNNEQLRASKFAEATHILGNAVHDYLSERAMSQLQSSVQ
jgi:hypothetical protein